MRVLTLDVGNSSVDVCFFDGELRYVGKFAHRELPRLEASKVLVSSVKPSYEPYLKDLYPHAELLRPEDVPLETSGIDKGKVGIDRLLNLYGALRLYSKDIILVSFGTALVVDLAVDGVYMGGFITLGLLSSLKCLHERAELLPELSLEKVEALIGTDTRSAMLGGLFAQTSSYIAYCKERWERHFKKELQLLLTGGDGRLFENMGLYDPLLIHRSMLNLAGFL